MKSFLFLSIIQTILSIPLEQNSFLSLRSIVPPRASGGNQPPPPTYSSLILEEWNTGGIVQQWNVPCSLPGLSTELWTEGYLSPRYPWGDQVWFLCRNVPANSSLSYSPAPVQYMYLTEDGILGVWIEEALYTNGTNLLNIVPYWYESQNLNVFYLLGGGTTANGPSSPARPATPRIRVDSGPGTPPDTQGALLSSMSGITINQLRILNHTLYGTGLFAGSIGIPAPTIFQIGSQGNLPTGTRNPTSNIAGFPLVLSVWTDPFSPFWWRTGLNRTAYVALHNNEDGSDLTFPVPPAASAGTLGGVSWKVATARKEGTDFAVYLTNSSHLVRNTLNGLQTGISYQTILQAPPGWQFLSVHARNPTIPTPSATATATATSSASASSTSSASTTSSSTSSPSASATATSGPTPTPFPSATATPSSYPSLSSSASSTSIPSLETTPSSTVSQTLSITPSPSNSTIPIPDSNVVDEPITPGGAAGITIGSLVVLGAGILLVFRFVPSLRGHFVRFFGMSSNTFPKNLPKRGKKVVSSGVIEISQNPYAIAQQRVEQLKTFQKKSLTEENAKRAETSRAKKEFAPVVSGESV